MLGAVRGKLQAFVARPVTVPIAGSLKGAVGGAVAAAGLAGVAGGAGGIAAGLVTAARKAADLGESVSKVQVTFGSGARAMIDQADQLAARFGVVKRESLDAAAAFGLMGIAAGMSKAQASGLGQEFVKLGLDLASYHNISNEEAFLKLRAGLSGEAEPLRPLGILLSEDAVKAEALAAGIVKVKRELTDAEKVAARASLIRKQAGPAIGDLERTAGSNANQLRKLQGDVENWLTDFGQHLQGALKDGISLAHELGDAFRQLTGKDFAEHLAESIRAGINTTRTAVKTEDPAGYLFASVNAALGDWESAIFSSLGLGENFLGVKDAANENRQHLEGEAAKQANLPFAAGPTTPEELKAARDRYLAPFVEEARRRIGDWKQGIGALAESVQGREFTPEERARQAKLDAARATPEAGRTAEQKDLAREADRRDRLDDARRRAAAMLGPLGNFGAGLSGLLTARDRAEEERRLRLGRIEKFDRGELGFNPRLFARGLADNLKSSLAALPGLLGNVAASGAARATLKRNDVLGLGPASGAAGGLLAAGLALGRGVAQAIEHGPENRRKAGERELDRRERARESARRRTLSAEFQGDPEDYARQGILAALNQPNAAAEDVRRREEERDRQDRERLLQAEQESRDLLRDISTNIGRMVQAAGRPFALVPRG